MADNSDKNENFWQSMPLNQRYQAGGYHDNPEEGVANYFDPNGYKGMRLTGSQQEQYGQLAGLELARLGYGQNIAQTGQDISRIRELQKQRTNGADPVSAAIMSQKASAGANAQRSLAASGVKGGVAAGAADQIMRQRDQDIAASLYGQQRQNIQDERSLASNELAGTVALMQGGKGGAVQMPNAPTATGMFGTVICTELFNQGYMDLGTYMLDCEYGAKKLKESPEVLYGYRFLASPVVKLMKKSKAFTWLVSIPALKWAEHMAGKEKNLVGYLAGTLGEGICWIVGKLITTKITVVSKV